ncbi:hypothetical protein O181_024331 [Austropuccinia psidii MF-1]|uniref:Reverse transcriptase domain-containing protein n=1 Tax=Austropuccinia psidii MF-1 TaxID=1389203 RepID=A0A9Q3GYI9_9BASI|nr:hypothetical protein [Austropuccinia psidii MF-1]
MILLYSWIKEKWRKGNVVAGLFLDEKPAYPVVHREKLVQVITQKQAPYYIIAVIQLFLLTRYTELRLDYFKYQIKLLERGLPQGSPLSLTLYLIYNFELIDSEISPASSNQLSIGYIDDVTHLAAEEETPVATKEREDLGRRAVDWGRKIGSEFNKKRQSSNYSMNPKRNIDR